MNKLLKEALTEFSLLIGALLYIAVCALSVWPVYIRETGIKIGAIIWLVSIFLVILCTKIINKHIFK